MDIKELREAAKDIAHAAIKAVDPEALVHKFVHRDQENLWIGEECVELGNFERIIVVGAGKAGGAMSAALEEILGDRISDGTVIVKDGHTRPLEHITLLEASHPVPDERGVAASRAMLALAEKHAAPDTLVICVISGGGSALTPLPYEPITLEAKQETTRLLLQCGATIEEINTVRKHISRIKGGRLARAASPSRMFSLILSDVVGDTLDVIASGLTVGDPSTFSDARAIFEKYDIWREAPQFVRKIIENGERGEIPESPKPEDVLFQKVFNIIIGNNFSALQAASKKAESLGFRPMILSSRITGEAREVGALIATIANEVECSGNPAPPPACLLAGGETTVTIKGNGKGGRNQELALAAALSLIPSDRIVIGSVGTDGTDGPTDAAGAIVDTTTVDRAAQMGFNSLHYLYRNDSYSLFQSIGDLFVTGPTGTNVMDLIIALIG